MSEKPIYVSKSDVATGLKAIVAEYGEDFVYQQRDTHFGSHCVYVWQGEPDCIVGKLLHRLGVPVEQLARGDGEVGHPVGLLAGSLVEHLEELGVISAECGVSEILDRAQSRQDSGRTWGQSVREALHR